MFFNLKNKLEKKSCRYPGAVITESFELITACVNKDRGAGFKIDPVYRMGVESSDEFFSMFNTPVYAAVETQCCLKKYLSPKQGDITLDTFGDYCFSISEKEVEKVKNTVYTSLEALYPKDIYLLSLPLRVYGCDFIDFVSVNVNNNLCSIAVVKQQKIAAVYKFYADSGQYIRGYIGRVKRNWEKQYPDVSFPRKYFLTGYCPDVINPQRKDETFSGVFEHVKDFELLCCAGISCAAQLNLRPLPLTEKSMVSFMKKRSFFQLIPAALFVMVLTAGLIFKGADLFYRGRIEKIQSKNNNEAVLGDDLKNIASDVKRLSSELIRQKNEFYEMSGWSVFLSYITDNIPEGVYIEQLVSKVENSERENVKISITGWSNKKYSAVTEFVAILNNHESTSDVRLADIDQEDKKHSNLYRYRILCTLELKS